jgi:hypothetical protein
MLVALVSHKKLEHARVAAVAGAELCPVEAVDLRVCVNVPDTLQVHHHEVTLRELPREMAQALGDLLLARFYLGNSTLIVIEFLVFSIDEVLSIEVLVGGGIVEYFVDEAMDEFNQEVAWDCVNHFLIEFAHNLVAVEHCIDVFFH